MKRIINSVFVFLFSFPFSGFSQGEFNNWYFGHHAGMTFNSGSPVTLTNCHTTFATWGATVTESDSLGNLLFYSDGYIVFNRTHHPMPNGHNISGWAYGQTQGIFCVPSLQNKNLFYIFTVDWYPSEGLPNPNGLRYSVIDMQLDGGLGDIPPDQKNISFPGGLDAAQNVTGTRHHNNRFAWVVVRKYSDPPRYASFLINETGVDTTAVFSNSLVTINLFPYDSTNDFNQTTCIKISPDGNKLFTAYLENGSGNHYGVMEVCDFNSQNGQITPLFLIPIEFSQQSCALEFSRDSKYIYAAEIIGPYARILQYDAAKTDSFSFDRSKIMIDTVGPHGVYTSGLQLGPDGKIYSTVYDTPYLNVINNPSVPGLGCDYQHNVVDLLGNDAWGGFPQLLQRYFIYLHHTGQCQGSPISFSATLHPPADSLHWDFGDPGSGNFNYSNVPNPTHIYDSAGTYNVTLIVKHNDMRFDTAWQTVTIHPTPHPDLGPYRTICIGDSTTFDAGYCDGCTYIWSNLTTQEPNIGNEQIYTTGEAGQYMVRVTSSNGCMGRDTTWLFTTPPPVVINDPPSKTICSGDSTFIVLSSSEPGATFSWTASLTSGNVTGFSSDSGLFINQVLINHETLPGVVTYAITPRVGSCVGPPSDYIVTVTPSDSVNVSITASENNICEGTQITFNATPINGGTTPRYQWKVNGTNAGTDSPTYSYTPSNNDLVSCILTSSDTSCISNNPAASNYIMIVVYPPLEVSISITATENPICEGTYVTYTAAPTNEGPSPIYQWKVNGANVGINSQTYAYTPANGDLVTCVLTSSIAFCITNNPATSNSITMTVNPPLPVSVSIQASSNPFCLNSSVTFTTTPTNEGTTPFYQWKLNGINVGINSPTYSYTPANNDLVSCILTSSELCATNNPATSNTVTMIVNDNLPAGVIINANPNPFCQGTTVTFGATPVNGGNAPSYQWKVNGINSGTDSPCLIYSPQAGDSVWCLMTSNLICVTNNPATSNKITMVEAPSPIVTFTRCFDSITTVNAKPFQLKGGLPLGGIYSGPGVNSSTGVFTPSVAGIGTKTIAYSYTNVYLCSASSVRTITVQSSPPFTCGNTLTDIRDGKVYRTIQVGSKCWMGANLNYGSWIHSSSHQIDNCIPEKYCPHDLQANCQWGTATYQWDELVQYGITAAPDYQGVCPPGWHIPSAADFQELIDANQGNGLAGSFLTDLYLIPRGFEALLQGMAYLNTAWAFTSSDTPAGTIFWTSTPGSNNKIITRGVNSRNQSVSLYESSKANALPVRCVKD